MSQGAPLTAGQVLAGRYALESPLGRGGMGSVWRARHVITRRQVALKLLRPSFELRQDMRQRVFREARAAASVGHPCVVDVLDVLEQPDGAPLLVMEYLEGETLGALLSREGALELEQALSLLLPVLAAVGTAHLRGVVHRDLKPDNVFIVRQGERVEPKVLDFGIAKLLGEDLAVDRSPLTGTGVVLGTPCYMAPEQSFGERNIDARADIWSLGAILYEALSGGRPVEGENLGQVIRSFLTQGITPIDALVPELPPEVSRLVMRMLAKEAAERPAGLAEVYDTLLAFSGGRSSVPGIIPAPAETATIAAPRQLERALATTSLALPASQALDTVADGAHTLSVVHQPRKPWLLLGAATLTLSGALLVLTREQPPPAPLTATASEPSPAPPEASTVGQPPAPPAPAPSETAPPSVGVARAPVTRLPVNTRKVPPSSLVASEPVTAPVAATSPPVAATTTPTPRASGGLEEEPPF